MIPGSVIPLIFASLPSPPPPLGTAYEGGYFAGQIQVSGIIYNLVVAPKSGGEGASLAYKTGNSADTNPPSQNVEYGKLATDAFNDASHPLFQWAKGLSIGGYTDWYIPAKNELEIIYRNLKPTATSNSTSSGANANAVPTATSNYTAGSPTQTSVTVFQSGNSEAFIANYYWSATESASNTGAAWTQIFSNGSQGTYLKSGLLYARAIRRVPA